MERVPLEYITRHAARTVADYLATQVEDRRKAGYVAVLVEDFANSFYYMPCDKHGFPTTYQMSYMTLDILSVQTFSKGQEYAPVDVQVEETTVVLERPMLSQRVDWQDMPYIFLWSGRIMSRRKVPIEKLNVSELMRLAQAAIKNREGLVIDEAIRNKVYK